MEGSTRAPVRYAACLLFAGTLALGGCTNGGGGAGGGASPPSTSSTTTATSSVPPSSAGTPTVTSPAGGTARTDHSVAGGAAFIRFYFDELNKAYMQPDSTRVVSLSASDCGFCNKNLERIRDLERSHEKYTSDLVSISKPTAFDGAPKGQRYYQATVTQLGAQHVDSQGRSKVTDARGHAVVNVVLTWGTRGWLLLGVEST